MTDTSGFLFHGTNREYHDRQVERFGMYLHDENDVIWVSDIVNFSGTIARNRAISERIGRPN